MLFKSVTINNLFSYYKENCFDLSIPVNSQKNIIILMGRNGGGKTSFINSVKLLFLGTADEIRRTVQRNRIPTKKQYVCGIENEWAGILNLKAKNENVNKCSVQIVWDSDDGEVVAERNWTINFVNSSYESQVTVNAGFRGEMHDEDAKNYLEQCLPKAYVPYFFFDGEEIRALAEANSKEIISTMERLLNIRPLENVQEQLHVLRRNWKKEAANREIERKLTEAETELRRKKAKQAELDQKISDIQNEIEEQYETLNKISRDLRLLWAIPNQASEARLQEQKKHKEERRQEILSELADGWQRDSFLCVLPELVEVALTETEKIVQNIPGSQAEFLVSLKQRLPAIFETPPYPNPRLELNQINFYQRRISKELEVFSVYDQHNTLFQIDGTKANSLSRLLAAYHPTRKPASQIQEKLLETQKLRQELHAIEGQLRDTGNLSAQQREQHDALQDQEKIEKDTLIDLQLNLKKLEVEKQNNNKLITSITKEIETIESDLVVAQEYRLQYDFAKRVVDILDEVKNELKVQKRKELESTYNKHLNSLLDSNTLIDHVLIDSYFSISYQDKDGYKIGMSSISAGMKQLSATALLWALKDVSGRDIPIIIDTPMGRIDRKHQENLLFHYYPNVGKQIIILPTDSELDEQKHSLLKPYINREYTLNNPDGKETKVVLNYG